MHPKECFEEIKFIISSEFIQSINVDPFSSFSCLTTSSLRLTSDSIFLTSSFFFFSSSIPVLEDSILLLICPDLCSSSSINPHQRHHYFVSSSILDLHLLRDRLLHPSLLLSETRIGVEEQTEQIS